MALGDSQHVLSQLRSVDDSADTALSIVAAADRSEPAASARPVVRGKFLFLNNCKFYIRGVTYGTFQSDELQFDYPPRHVVALDFAAMAARGINTVRVYTVPPRWLLDEAHEQGLHVMVGLPWEQHVTFLDSASQSRAIEERLRQGVRACAGHPAVLCYAVGNEIPGPIVRWHGKRRVERFLKRLYRAAKQEDPGALVTYVNYPTTEYLELPFLDFMCFNVYLETEERLGSYLAHLQGLAGDGPLVLAEVGLDSQRNGEQRQAETLQWQVQTIFARGCAGMFWFAWTDEWHRGGHEILDWDFGLTRRDRSPKPALAALESAYAQIPFPDDTPWPRVSVVVCTYNGSRTLDETLTSLARLDYPGYEVILVDDGSRDRVPEIAARHPGVRYIRTENHGLSSARNTGLRAATGEIVAYIDDDAWPDIHWLKYLAHTFLTTNHAGVGGPNLPPPGDGAIADCVANAPGGPVHVLLDNEVAEHIPGCNMAFRRQRLLSVGGFDRQYRAAGDDVDACWRLQKVGWTLGFSPAALVWHHRRNSVKAYWKQQLGYGKAEALLEKRWPEKYNAAGHITWSGRLYGRGLLIGLAPRRRIYHGVWGTSPFQSIYTVPAHDLLWLPMMPEWHLLNFVLTVVAVLGILWPPLLWALIPLATLAGLPLFQALRSVASARFTTPPAPVFGRMWNYILTFCLYLMQPQARLYGRLRNGLHPMRLKQLAPAVLPRPVQFDIWSERWRPLENWLAAVEASLIDQDASVESGTEFDRWDLQVSCGLLAAVRIRATVEEHGSGRQLVRVRAWPYFSRTAVSLVCGIAGISGLAVWSGQGLVGTTFAVMAAGMAFQIVRETSSCFSALRKGLFVDRIKSRMRLSLSKSPSPSTSSAADEAEFAAGLKEIV